MDEFMLDLYKGKIIRLFLHNNFVYTGECINISNDFLTIDDKKEGIISINLNQIKEIKEYRRNYDSSN